MQRCLIHSVLNIDAKVVSNTNIKNFKQIWIDNVFNYKVKEWFLMSTLGYLQVAEVESLRGVVLALLLQ